MVVLLTIVLIIGLVGIIGNQYSGIKRMESIQRSLDDINQKIRDMNSLNR
ncbi:hypothetical protein KCTCHS21_53530 [Cohnella abietis]|uniref:Uncharacterized protein n=1 Tax=Cohnella abietis TaxID=2507935 RepID=A0A3T1DD47_9BACL|nr:hypothetical protein KCTCHS21_53530 [Cohnella abietis]